jgi:hypothetical protein
MFKAMFLGAALTLTAVAGVGAQNADLPAADLPQNGGPGIRAGHIAATGATVPNPGVPQAGPTTPIDSQVGRQDDRIVNSICKGC